MTNSQPHIEGIRLQKVLAEAGVASRRAAEGLIAEGRVSVDGQVVTQQGTRVDPETAEIRVDGERIPSRRSMVYLALNKPLGTVSTMSDPQGRPALDDLVADRAERLFHVGRLDIDSEGLLLLTNDGETAHRLTHPSFEVPKVYRAVIGGRVAADLGRVLKTGVELEDGHAAVDGFRVLDQASGKAQVELTIHSGRNRIVRRLLAHVGHPVQRLVRIQLGPIHLGGLKAGDVRVLNRHEVGALLDLLDKPVSR